MGEERAVRPCGVEGGRAGGWFVGLGERGRCEPIRVATFFLFFRGSCSARVRVISSIVCFECAVGLEFAWSSLALA